MQKLFSQSISVVVVLLSMFVAVDSVYASVTVSGRVLNTCAGGVQPLAGALVEVNPVNSSPTIPKPLSVASDMFTDDEGRFELTIPEDEAGITISYFNHVIYSRVPVSGDLGDIYVNEPSACKVVKLVYLPNVQSGTESLVQSASTIFDYARVIEIYFDENQEVFDYTCFFYGGSSLQVIGRFEQKQSPFFTTERVLWHTTDAAIGGIGCEGSPVFSIDPKVEELKQIRFSADSGVITVPSNEFRWHLTLFISQLFK